MFIPSKIHEHSNSLRIHFSPPTQLWGCEYTDLENSIKNSSSFNKILKITLMEYDIYFINMEK